MKPRKTDEIIKVLEKKGFSPNKKKAHHQYYNLIIDGIKYPIYTYFSHGIKEYSSNLMGRIKNQLKFEDSNLAEEFFNCPMGKEEYVNMLRKNNII
jgi:hypothetical protein